MDIVRYYGRPNQKPGRCRSTANSTTIHVKSKLNGQALASIQNHVSLKQVWVFNSSIFWREIEAKNENFKATQQQQQQQQQNECTNTKYYVSLYHCMFLFLHHKYTFQSQCYDYISSILVTIQSIIGEQHNTRSRQSSSCVVSGGQSSDRYQLSNAFEWYAMECAKCYITCIFFVYRRAFRRVCMQRIYKRQVREIFHGI